MEDVELFLATLTADTDALRHIVAINRALSKIFGGNKYNMVSWLTSDNKDFGEDYAPAEIMLQGESGMKTVREYLEQAADRGA